MLYSSAFDNIVEEGDSDDGDQRLDSSSADKVKTAIHRTVSTTKHTTKLPEHNNNLRPDSPPLNLDRFEEYDGPTPHPIVRPKSVQIIQRSGLPRHGEHSFSRTVSKTTEKVPILDSYLNTIPHNYGIPQYEKISNRYNTVTNHNTYVNREVVIPPPNVIPPEEDIHFKPGPGQYVKETVSKTYGPLDDGFPEEPILRAHGRQVDTDTTDSGYTSSKGTAVPVERAYSKKGGSSAMEDLDEVKPGSRMKRVTTKTTRTTTSSKQAPNGGAESRAVDSDGDYELYQHSYGGLNGDLGSSLNGDVMTAAEPKVTRKVTTHSVTSRAPRTSVETFAQPETATSQQRVRSVHRTSQNASVPDMSRYDVNNVSTGDKKFLKKVQHELETQRGHWQGHVADMLDGVSLKTNLAGKKNTNSYVDMKSGQPVFKAFVDISKYPPNSISVAVDKIENKVIVHAKEKGQGNLTRSFTQKVQLPRFADDQRMRTRISKDGILLIELPLIFYFDGENRENARSFINQVKTMPDGTKCLEIVVKVNSEFNTKDVKVQLLDDNKLLVAGTYDVMTTPRNGEPAVSQKKRRIKQYALPPNADVDRIRSKLDEDGRLIISIPLKE